MDTLFGHQAEVLALDLLRQERAVSAGNDHTCRVWKVPEESQLIYRAQAMAVECCKYVTGTDWVSGSSTGGLQLWNQMKKRPVCHVREAHGREVEPPPGAAPPRCHVDADVAGWVQSVAVCRGTDLVASGAGDGYVRLWHAAPGPKGSALHSLTCCAGFAANGFVNGLQVARSGKFVVAAVGQEPRLGRWVRNAKARNGLLVQPLQLHDDGPAGGG